jgi:preprotein translocase subunit SecG
MLYGLFLSFYFIICILLILTVLIQKSKGSMGLGSIGGGAQTLFGGSGGQDVFQKITWILGGLFMAGSLLLALMKSHQAHQFTFGAQHGMVEQKAPITE